MTKFNFTEDIISELPPSQIEKIKKEYLTTKIIEILEDSDYVLAIDSFFNSNLNISETAKVTFMHRNTLTYRINKIEKLTGLNIRLFKDAFLFKVLMMIHSNKF